MPEPDKLGNTNFKKQNPNKFYESLIGVKQAR